MSGGNTYLVAQQQAASRCDPFNQRMTMTFKTMFGAGMLLGMAAHAQLPVKQLSQATPFANTITPDFLEQRLRVLASAEMEGRETGTPGQEKAAAYIESQFQGFGLKPGAAGQWRQYYPMFIDTLGSHTALEVNGKHIPYGDDFKANIMSSHGDTLENVPVVFVGRGIADKDRDDYAGLDVKGKVVLFLSEDKYPTDSAYTGSARGLSDAAKRFWASNKGAKAVLVLDDNPRKPDFPRAGFMRMQRNPGGRMANEYLVRSGVAALISGVDSASLKTLKPGTLPNPVSILYEKVPVELKPSNVLAFLEGTDKKDEVLFITGHYDHLGKKDGKIYYGADDDGSGTTAVLALAHAFEEAKKAGKGPRRSIVFMTVSGEEKGLLGSNYYVEHPLYPLEKTVADLNTDMVGRIDPGHEQDTNYIYLIGDNKLSSAMRPISEAANDEFTKMKLDYTYNDPKDVNRFYYRSDHYNFAQHGIPIIFYFNGVHEDYHKPTDTVDKIHFGLMARRVQLVFYTAWDIANREEKLPVDRHEQ